VKVAVIFNRALIAIDSTTDDLASDHEMDLIPDLAAEELATRGYNPVLIAADFSVGQACKEASVNIALNLAEGFGGTNGYEALVPTILDYSNVRYTGADAANMYLVRDKAAVKATLRWLGVPVPPEHLILNADSLTLDDFSDVTLPAILKPGRQEASIGITFESVVRDLPHLVSRAAELLRLYGSPVLVEPFISGRELSAGVVGNRYLEFLPPCEFLFRERDPLRQFRSFEHKWLGEQEEIVAPSGLDPAVAGELARYTTIAHQRLGCRDYSRADFRLDAAGRLWFLEHNYNPGIGPNTHGLSNTLTRMYELRGQSFGDLLEAIVVTATERYQS